MTLNRLQNKYGLNTDDDDDLTQNKGLSEQKLQTVLESTHGKAVRQ